MGSLWVVLWGRCGLLWVLCGVGVCFCGDLCWSLCWSLCGVSVGLCEPMRVFVGSLWVSVESMGGGVRCGPLWVSVGDPMIVSVSLCVVSVGLCVSWWVSVGFCAIPWLPHAGICKVSVSLGGLLLGLCGCVLALWVSVGRCGYRWVVVCRCVVSVGICMGVSVSRWVSVGLSGCVGMGEGGCGPC